MKSILSRLTPRGLFILILLTELVLGVTYIGVILSQEVGLAFSLFVQYVYRFLHSVCLILGLALALRSADGRRIYHGAPQVCLLIVALTVKEYFTRFYTYSIVNEELAGDALLSALPDAAIYGLLYTGLFLAAVYALAYLFFCFSQDTDAIPTDPWAMNNFHTLAGTCFVACCVTIPEWILTIVDQVLFLTREAAWLPSVDEVISMALDLLLIPLFGVLAYLAAYMAHRYGKKKTVADTDATEDITLIS